MPLGRYLSGSFEAPPLPAGQERHERPRSVASTEEAGSRVAAMQEHMSNSLGIDVRWPDDGEVAFSACFSTRMLHALRSVAAHHEYPPRLFLVRRGFKLRSDPRDSPSLRKIYDGGRTRFSHLMRHPDNRGFWFPVDFPEPCECNESEWWRIGSCQGLARELEEVGNLVQSVASGHDRELLEKAHAFFAGAVATAVQRRLPLVIEG
jgi:hypothetical protein